MDGIERAIRNALDKGDASDRAFREKVYRSAFSALERTLAGSAGITDDMRARRRATLKETVRRIETEFDPALAPEPPPPAMPREPEIGPEVGIDAGPGRERATPPPGRAEPVFAPEPRAAPGPAGGRARSTGPDLAAERDEMRLRQARPSRWPGLVLGLLVLAAIAGGGWWVWQSGLFRAPPPVVATGDRLPTAGDTATRPQMVQAVDDDAWTRIFSPDDPTTVTATGEAVAEIAAADGETFLRASSGASGTPVRFSIGEGILQRMAGGRAVFRISAGAEEEAGETQIAVECDLAALGDCGRRRYLVGITREDFLFELEFPGGAPGGAGTISINTDIEGGGRPVRIHSISVAPAR